jgi:hypothetical protein
MTLATAFPDDLAACHAMLAEKDAAIASQGSVIEQLEHRVEEQKRELAKVSAERDVAFQLAFRKRERAPEPWFGPLRIRSLGSLEQLLPSGWPPSSFSAESLGVSAIATFFLAIDADRLGV